MMGQLLAFFGIDNPYTWVARRMPALVVLAPMATLVGWLAVPGAAPANAAVHLAGLLAAIVVTTFASVPVREAGKRLEERLGGRVGPAYTVRVLRGKDSSIPSYRVDQVRQVLAARSPDVVPARRMEQQRPDESKERWGALLEDAIHRMRPIEKESLLLAENMSYGYQRNLLAIRPVGAASLAVVGVFTAAAVFGTERAVLTPSGLVHLGVCACTVVLWIMVDEEGLVRASRRYTGRLFTLIVDEHARPE